MRYTNRPAFIKAIQSSSPNHLSRIYLVLITNDFERGKAIDAILRQLGNTPPCRFDANCDLNKCLEHLSTTSLFGEEPIAILDEVEKLTKSELQRIPLAIAYGYLILSARGKTPLLPACEKAGIVLDMLEEKPWDKEKRLAQELHFAAEQAGKRLAPEVPLLLFERLEKDSATLHSELHKLICYVGDAFEITASDVLALTQQNQSQTLWQMAEELVWEQRQRGLFDDGDFHALVPAIRAQLQLGLKIAALLETNTAREQWGRALGKVYPKTLDKRTSEAARLGSRYFAAGLKKLFKIELLSRTESNAYGALLDLFRMQLKAICTQVN